MSKKFNHLNIPSHWQSYWTRFPEGHTILEALIQWVSQVDEMVDNQNKLSDTVSNYGTRLDQFIDQFEGHLSEEVKDTLGEWQDSGFLEVVISEALQWQLDDYITTNEQDKNDLTEQLAHIWKQVTNDLSSDEIQDVLDNYRKVQFLDGDFLIDKPIHFRSNSHITFSPNTVFRAAENSFTTLTDCMFNAVNTENVKLTNTLKIVMNKEKYIEGEWRHGVNLLTVRNFEADTIDVSNSGGDGVYIGRDRTYLDISDGITIGKIIANNNTRNGLSIICGRNIYIETVIATNTVGKAPQFGVDFEPNFNFEFLQNITINNLYTKNNASGGLIFAIGLLKDAEQETTITINNHVSIEDGNVAGVRFAFNSPEDSTKSLSGFIKVLNSYVLNPDGKGVDFFNYSSKAPRITANIIVENPGAQSLDSSDTAGRSGFYFQTYSDNSSEKVGNFELVNCRVIDTRETPRLTIPFYLPSSVKRFEKVRIVNPVGINQTNKSNGVVHIGKGDSVIINDDKTETALTASTNITHFQGSVITNSSSSSSAFTLPKASDYPNAEYEFVITEGVILVGFYASDRLYKTGLSNGANYVMRTKGDYLKIKSNGVDGWLITEEISQPLATLAPPSFIGQQAILGGNVSMATSMSSDGWVQLNG